MGSIALGAVLAILSQVSQIGKGLQKEGVKSLPELSLSSALQYLTSRTWVLGLVLDIGGALVGLASLSMLPISVAQPIFCNGLAFLALFSALYLKETLQRLEWLAIALCLAGTMRLASTLEPTDWSKIDIGCLQRKLVAALILSICLLFLLEMAAARAKEANHPRTVELVAGTQAGMLIGAGNAGLSSGLQILQVGVGHQRIFAALFAIAGIACTASHPVFANRGYKMGRVVIITAYITLVSLFVGVAMGLVVLGEPWPSRWAPRALRRGALTTISASVFLLNWEDVSQTFREGLSQCQAPPAAVQFSPARFSALKQEGA